MKTDVSEPAVFKIFSHQLDSLAKSFLILGNAMQKTGKQFVTIWNETLKTLLCPKCGVAGFLRTASKQYVQCSKCGKRSHLKTVLRFNRLIN